VRVILCEDNALLRDGLERLLTTHGVEVVASVAHPDAFLGAVERERPDACVVDVRLPPSFGDEGVRAAIEARRLIPGLPIVILSQYVERTYARELLGDGAGGIGYLLKDRVANPAEFVEALQRVAAGGTALDPEAVSALIGGGAGRDRLESLTPREREVLELLAEGRSNKGIADQLVVTERAVEKHISNVFAKLDLPATGRDHRRVLAVLTWLEQTGGPGA
jgi:DNA-binding NarL/FixJ family response regulator